MEVRRGARAGASAVPTYSAKYPAAQSSLLFFSAEKKVSFKELERHWNRWLLTAHSHRGALWIRITADNTANCTNGTGGGVRSEERRVGKEWRCGWWRYR